jgi:hypothetical protein
LITGHAESPRKSISDGGVRFAALGHGCDANLHGIADPAGDRVARRLGNNCERQPHGDSTAHIVIIEIPGSRLKIERPGNVLFRSFASKRNAQRAKIVFDGDAARDFRDTVKRRYRWA